MVWYGMVWYGMVWYGMVWYGMVWYMMRWDGMVWYGMRLDLQLRHVDALARGERSARHDLAQHEPLGTPLEHLQWDEMRWDEMR
jgi:hypothetical protein